MHTLEDTSRAPSYYSEAAEQITYWHQLVESPSTARPESPELPSIHTYKLAQAAFQRAGLGNLNYLTDHPETIPSDQLEIITHNPLLRDKVGAEVPARYHIRTKDIHRASQIAASLGLQAVIIGALTSGTENFGAPGVKYNNDMIIAIEASGVDDSRKLKQSIAGPYALSDEISINLETGEVRVGAGPTPNQINELLPAGKWLAIDATTSGSLRAVIPTNPMGPIRIRPSRIITEAKMSDGSTLATLDQKEVEHHEGLLGLTGAIVETTYKILDVPTEKFGIFVGLNVPTLDPDSTNWDQELAKTLAELYPSMNLKIDGKNLVSDWEDGFLSGCEVITINELEFLLDKPVSEDVKKLAQNLIKNLRAASSTYGLFITGRAKADLFKLEDKPGNPIQRLLHLQEENKIATVDDITRQTTTMLALREAIPLSAKAEADPSIDTNPDHLKFSTTTDHVTTISASAREHIATLYGAERTSFIQANVRRQLRPYLARQKVFAQIRRETTNPRIRFASYNYGHAHIGGAELDGGMDPHERESAFADLTGLTGAERLATIAEFEAVKNRIKTEANGTLDQGIDELEATDPDVARRHGEKGKLPVFKELPKAMQEEAADALEAAPPLYSWRAVGSKAWQYRENRRSTRQQTLTAAA